MRTGALFIRNCRVAYLRMGDLWPLPSVAAGLVCAIARYDILSKEVIF